MGRHTNVKLHEQRKVRIAMYQKKGLNLREIGERMKLSRERIRQYVINYVYPPYKPVPPEKNKYYTKYKREFLGLYAGKLDQKGDSINRFREIVRIRDSHTCQKCGKLWKEGLRRFDVHHLDEQLEGNQNRDAKCLKIDKENIDRLQTLCHKCHMNLDCVRSKMLK